mgnify:CR=1 FL=1
MGDFLPVIILNDANLKMPFGILNDPLIGTEHGLAHMGVKKAPPKKNQPVKIAAVAEHRVGAIGAQLGAVLGAAVVGIGVQRVGRANTRQRPGAVDLVAVRQVVVIGVRIARIGAERGLLLGVEAVAIGILVGITAALFIIFHNSARIQEAVQTESELASMGRIALSRMEREIGQGLDELEGMLG